MNINDKQQALIEKYLDKNLSSIQLQAFEEELKNETFRKQLLFQARIVDAHRAIKKEDLIGELESFAQANKKRSNGKRNWKLLAGIIGLVLIAFVLLFNLKANDQGQKLYADYFIELPADVDTRGNQQSVDDSYRNFMQLYANKDYATALQSISGSEGKTELIQLYTAVCHLQLNNLTSAEKTLIPLLQSKDVKVLENAQYYQALIYVNQNQNDKAVQLLQTITQKQDHLFHVKASALLEEMGSR